MTTAEALTILGHRLEDPTGDLFDDTLKYLMLNRGQDKLIQYLNPHLLQELQSSTTAIALTEDSELPDDYNDYFTASDLGSTPFGGLTGIFGIRDATTGDFYTKTSFETMMMAMDAVRAIISDRVSSAYPSIKFYFLKNRVYCHPGLHDVNVYYIRQPAEFGSTIDVLNNLIVGQRYSIVVVGTTDFTAHGASANTVGVEFVATNTGLGTGTVDVECPLERIFHDAWVELAEYELWMTNRDFDKSQEALSRAMAIINQHNTSIPALNIPDQVNDPFYNSHHI